MPDSTGSFRRVIADRATALPTRFTSGGVGGGDRMECVSTCLGGRLTHLAIATVVIIRIASRAMNNGFRRLCGSGGSQVLFSWSSAWVDSVTNVLSEGTPV